MVDVGLDICYMFKRERAFAFTCLQDKSGKEEKVSSRLVIVFFEFLCLV